MGNFNLGAMVSFLCVQESWTEEAEAKRAQRILVFDVDGSCSIATPFDSDVERPPHP